MKSAPLWLPAIHAQVALDQKKSAEAIDHLRRALPQIEYGQIAFIAQISCLYPTYIRGQAYLAAGQGKEAAAEFQKILDHSGMVWNCWTGALARLGVARANAWQAKNSTGADADAAWVRALAACKDFVTLWKDADPEIPIYKQAKAEYAKILQPVPGRQQRQPQILRLGPRLFSRSSLRMTNLERPRAARLMPCPFQTNF